MPVIIISIIAVIAALFLIAAIILFKICSQRTVSGVAGRVINAAMPEELQRIFGVTAGYEFWKAAQKEAVEIQSFDGITLRGEYCACPNPKRTIICVHGYRSTGINNFAFAIPDFIAMDCNILLIDQRACGKSGGRYICFGMKERYDVLSWVKWLNESHGAQLPVYLDGVSLGGATVLMASSLALPGNVAGIIADCGYTSPSEILKYIIKTYIPLPVFPTLPLISLITKLVTGNYLTDADTRECVKKTNIPIAFVHGAKDRFVPVYMGQENFEACRSEKVMYISENAEHGMSFIEDRKECLKLLADFFAAHDGMKSGRADTQVTDNDI